MNSKQIAFLAIAVVVLAVIYLLLQSGNVPKAEIRMLVDVDTSKVSEVTIYYDGSTTTLKRENNGWQITNPFEYPANTSFIKTLLKKLADLRIESEITKNKSRWDEFELNDDKATRVTIKQDGSESVFYIGKAASGYKQTYARLAGKDTVYLIRGTYGVAVNRKPESWREKKVADFTDQQVSAIRTGKFDLVREGEDWRVNAPDGTSFIADQGKAERIVRSLQNLRTSDFPDSTEYAGINWDKPDYEAVVELMSGEKKTIRLYKQDKEEKRFFMRYDDRPTVFRVYKGMVGQIFKDPEELKAEPKKDMQTAEPK